jgi:hypothetical protein
MKRFFVAALSLFLICDSVSNVTSAAQDERFDRSYEPPAPCATRWMQEPSIKPDFPCVR